MALQFASLGAYVVLLDKDKDALNSALFDAHKAYDKFKTWVVHNGYAISFGEVLPRVLPIAIAVDLTDRQKTYAAMRRVKKLYGGIDILINNAGVVTGKKLLECPDALIDLSFQVNAISHFWTVKAVLPSMLEANAGHIVTVASSAGLLGVPGLADYCASKYAAVGFDESLRFELHKLGKTGVKTTLVCPGQIDTGMFEGAKPSRFPNLVPQLTQEYAAERIVQAVRCERQLLIMPASLFLIQLLKGIVPPDIAVRVAEWFGALDFMSNFTGRAGAPPATAKRASKSPARR